MPDVTFTVDGKKLTAPAGSLLIDACRKAGIEIPAFCYYPGLSLQAACRMCVVRQEKVPKLQTACTTTVAEGQVFITESPEIAQARKATIELLLGNHPLDCPVCDAGGECELQDMTFKYGAGESLYAEAKHHRDEQQWSPAVFYDRPRCILCYRCIRMCGEGMDVWALGIHNRGVDSVIVPNVIGKDGRGHQLDCEQCGMCIDVCPVGALTSGSYRYKTRPWEMNHVSTVCTHCADGCKVTLGVRQTNDGSEIVRADNRDKSGINGDFLCAKGRFGFDFVDKPRAPHAAARPQRCKASSNPPPGNTRSASPPASSKRFATLAAALPSASSAPTAPPTKRTTCCRSSRAPFSTPTTSTTSAPPTTLPLPAPSRETPAKPPACATSPPLPPFLLVGGNPTEEHPLLAWLLRTNVRLNRARLYIANSAPIKLDRQAKAVQHLPADGYKDLAGFLSAGNADFSQGHPRRGIARRHLRPGDSRQGRRESRRLGPQAQPKQTSVSPISATTPTPAAQPTWASSPTCCPATSPSPRPAPSPNTPICPPRPAKPCRRCIRSRRQGELGALLVVGANPVSRLKVDPAALQNTFLVVQDLFLTETAALADVVLPAASLYEKSGTVTNTFGDIQMVRKAADRAGVKPDFEILVRLAGAMGADIKTLVPFGSRGTTADLGQSRGAQAGEADRHAVWLEANGLEPRLSPFDPLAVLDEIAAARSRLLSSTASISSPATTCTRNRPRRDLSRSLRSPTPDLVVPAHDTLFTSGTLGRY